MTLSLDVAPTEERLRIVVALGGNALNRKGEEASAANLRANVRAAIAPLARLALEHQLVITHGNGPQVGLLALQNLAYKAVTAYPIDILVAQTQGMLGYVVGQELANAIKLKRELATILTTTEVDPDDPAFGEPTKFVGPFYEHEEAQLLAGLYGWSIAADGDLWRRVVPSPEPIRIRQAHTIQLLLDLERVVLCVGGGGVPVILDEANQHLSGTQAVVDKDLASAVLARDIAADRLIILTDADAVYVDWGKPTQKAIRTASPEALAKLPFPAGSMGPKVDAARTFALDCPGEVVIGALRDLDRIVAGTAGTRVYSGAELTWHEHALADG